MEKLIFLKNSNAAILPTRATPFAAGCDLHSAESTFLRSRTRRGIRTDLCVQIPHNHYGRIAARSGLALNKGISVGGGVIDEDYRGELIVILFNHSDNDIYINTGMAIAQLICEKISYPVITESHMLEETERGEKGFGSTGY
jgi:dUTP pyrophosphatase